MNNIRQYIRFILPYWDKSLFSLISLAIVVLCGMATPLITKLLIDYAYTYKDFKLLVFLVIFGIVVAFISHYFKNLTDYLDTYIHQKLSIDLRRKFYNKFQALPMRFIKSKPAGDFLVRVTDDIDNVVDAAAEIVPVIAQTFLRLGALLFICFTLDQNLTFLALLGVPLYFIQTHFFSQKLSETQEQIQKKESEIMAFYQERVKDIKTIKSFNQGIYEAERLTEKLSAMFRLERKALFVRMLNGFLESSIIVLWVGLLSFYAGYRVINGHLSIGSVMAILVYLGQVHEPFIDFGDIYKTIINSFVSLRRINEVLEETPEAYLDQKTYVLFDLKGEIDFNKVSFIYHDADEYVLKNISLRASPGKKLALVGISGAGKSTILDLLQRFIEPSQGSITLDGQDIKTISLISLRANISIVSQESKPFTGTIKENILYGSYGPSVADEKRMLEAAKLAEIHEFILSLPEGYNTLIGEGGLQISGGQSQRLMIARAILRDAKILVMDEPTSALDSLSEKKIFENLKDYLKDKTVIIISHRLSFISDADEIIVIKGNTISERGAFGQLIDQRGEFYKFFMAQMKHHEL